MKFLLYNLLFLLLSFSLTAQSYEISEYKARFERRPFLELNPRLSYSSNLSNNEFTPNDHQAGASLSAFWRESSNLDHRIRSWSVSSNMGFNFRNYDDADELDRSNSSMFLQADLEQYNYRENNKFWGVRGNAFLNSQRSKEGLESADRRTQFSLIPGVFFGTGRIEFSEDALLANWMMDDLLEADAIATISPEQRLALAQRVTSIIGNRTFDFRRRRIYELKQLQLLFQEKAIEVKDEFLLFAILNDNWAFANRATLPHGQRWQFGLDAGGNYTFSSTPFNVDFFTLTAQPYISFEQAQIRHNNAATIWRAELSGFYQDLLDEGNSVGPVFNFRSETGAALRLSHTYVWLPISRTTLNWRNGVNLFFENFQEDDPFLRQDQLNTQIESVLVWNYFINYNWRFTLNAGVQAFLTNNEFTSTRSVRPFLGIQMNYAIF